MPLKLWTYDVAREQCPPREFLSTLARTSLEAGYDALGLYLEHRFTYASALWAAGRGAIGPDDIAFLRREFPRLRIIPFVNLLGHTEGFLYTERGKRFAETAFRGLQACPRHEGFRQFAQQIVEDVLGAFDDETIHLGGDETSQLGECPQCAGHDKASLYLDHFGSLMQRVLRAGRQPALWADMALEHPRVLDDLPRETWLFDWQYFDADWSRVEWLQQRGFRVAACPTLHTYNSMWLNIGQAEQNVRSAQESAGLCGADLCVTTWEGALFGSYGALLPAIRWAANPTGDLAAAFGDAEEWARLLGVALPELGGPFKPGRTRSSLKCRLLLYGNPFLAWQHHAADLVGELAGAALQLTDQAVSLARNSEQRAVATFAKLAVQFVCFADEARQAYSQGLPGVAAASLAPCRQIFEELEKLALANHLNFGGSLADVERCRIAKRHVEEVLRRIRDYGDGQLGYLPSFEALTHHQFCPHDQGCWWRINAWGSE